MYDPNERKVNIDDYDIPYDGRKRPIRIIDDDEIDDDDEDDRRGEGK